MVLEKYIIRIIFISTIFLYGCPVHLCAKKNAYIRNKVVNFGILSKSNKKVVAIFIIHNTGKSKIAISKVNIGCGCTTVKYSSEPINPGESIKVYIDVRTLYKRGKFDEGVLFRFSDGTTEVIHVRGLKDYY